MAEPLLEARDVGKVFAAGGGATVQALSTVSLTLLAGETHGLVGESGCGKTTLSRLLLRLEECSSGTVLFRGTPLTRLDAQQRRGYRRAVQPVFQNPYTSLNPRMRVARIVSEPLRMSASLSRREVRARVGEALRRVGLDAADAQRYPHEFSGGQRQRIAIARALASEPDALILDEAVSSQDISIRAQILNLLKDLQRELGLAYLFIAHDLATVRYMSDRMSVMYLGTVVETGDSELLYRNPRHPYTRALLAACLPADPDARLDLPPLRGEPPSPIDPPAGCRFHPRCTFATDECSRRVPALEAVAPAHRAACLLQTAPPVAAPKTCIEAPDEQHR